jgi:hypothetical protein
MDPSRSCPCIRKTDFILIIIKQGSHSDPSCWCLIHLTSKSAFIHTDNNAFYCTRSRVSITDTTCLIDAWHYVTVTSLYGQYASNGRRRCMVTLTHILLGYHCDMHTYTTLLISSLICNSHPVRDSFSDPHWEIHSSLHGGSNSHKSIRGGAI